MFFYRPDCTSPGVNASLFTGDHPHDTETLTLDLDDRRGVVSDVWAYVFSGKTFYRTGATIYFDGKQLELPSTERAKFDDARYRWLHVASVSASGNITTPLTLHDFTAEGHPPLLDGTLHNVPLAVILLSLIAFVLL